MSDKQFQSVFDALTWLGLHLVLLALQSSERTGARRYRVVEPRFQTINHTAKISFLPTGARRNDTALSHGMLGHARDETKLLYAQVPDCFEVSKLWGKN